MPDTNPAPDCPTRAKGQRGKLFRLLLLVASLGLAVVVLFVALDVTDVFRLGHPISTTTYANKTEVIKDWDKSAPWLPDDATDIQIKEVEQYGPKIDPAILRAASHSHLNPALCAETDRLSRPALTASWSPDTDVSKVYVCGSWDVVPTSNGWFGWAENSPQEQAAAAALLHARARTGE